MKIEEEKEEKFETLKEEKLEELCKFISDQSPEAIKEIANDFN